MLVFKPKQIAKIMVGMVAFALSPYAAEAQTGLASLSPAPISIFAGGQPALGDNGPATSANLANPRSIVFDPAGNLYIADSSHHRVRKVTTAGVISTIAGTGTASQTGNGGQATAATLNNPDALALDPTGNLLYVAEGNGNDVRVINLTTGVISLVAGTGTAGNTGDGGLATAATLNLPSGLAVDAASNVYVADANNNRVRKIVPGGAITAFAGTGAAGSTGDGGQAAAATLNAPRLMAFDPAGNLFVADYGGNRIRRITPGGVISTVAGTGAGTFSGDGGLATAATFQQIRGVALDAAGDLLIGDGANNRIRRVDTAGIVTTIAGGATAVCAAKTDTFGNGCLSNQATLSLPFEAITDSSGNLYIADFTNNEIREIKVGSSSIAFANQSINTSSAVQIVTVSNTGAGSLQLSGRAITGAGFAFAASGGTDCTASTLLAPGASCLIGVQFSPTASGVVSGSVTLTDNSGGATSAQQTISLTGTGVQPAPVVALTVTPTSASAGQTVAFKATVSYSGSALVPGGTVQFLSGSTVLGSGTLSAGVATFSSVINPGTYSVTAAYGGDANYLAATSSPAIALTVAPLAGDTISLTTTPATGLPGSTTALSVTVAQTAGSVVPTGSVAILDGTVTLTTLTLSGGQAAYNAQLSTGSHALVASYRGDGNYAPLLSSPASVTLGTAPTLSITPGILSTFAGTGVAGNTGNGGPAALATLNQPIRSAFDSTGNLYIADAVNNAVRRITPAGTISLFAGTGTGGHSGDNGPATKALISVPRDVAVDALGNVYILEAGYNDIRRVDTNGVISTFAGVPNATAAPTSGDGGQATSANLNTPRGIVFDSAGNLYIAEQLSNVIRKVTPAGVISTFAGIANTTGSPANGAVATNASLNAPYALGVDASNNLYFVQVGDNSVRRISTAGIITLVAGANGSTYTGDGGPGTSASLNAPRAVATDPGGNIYISDASNFAIRKVDTSGIITTIAGSGVSGNKGDGGPATAGALNQIYGITVDATGNLFLDDEGANVVRKVTVNTGLLAFPNQIPNTSSAVLSATIYNSGGQPLTLSGIALASGSPFALAPSGGLDCTALTVLAPGKACLIGVVFSPTARGPYTGTITVTDNSGGVSGSQQTIQLTGVAALVPTANLSVSPASVPVGTPVTISVTLTNSAFPAAGTPTGTVAIMNGTTTLNTLTLVNGAASYPATLPRGAYSLTAVYSGDTSFNPATSSAVALAVNGTATITTLAAGSTTVAQGASDLLTANISGTPGTPSGSVTFSSGGQALGTATPVNGVATLTAFFPLTGTQSLSAVYSGDAVFNPSTSTALSVAVTSGVVASFTPGIVTAIAGNGAVGSTGDGGPATSATLNAPGGTVALDTAGNLYIPDTNGNRIRKVTPAGVISTVAGTGVTGHAGDGGLATAALLNAPRAIAIDTSGNLFVLDSGYNTVRKIDPSGIITAFAGVPSTTGLPDTGDGGPATAATINTPRGMTIDAQNNLYIAENTGEVIRKITPAGIISTVAGTSFAGNIGNGASALAARLNSPNGVAIDAQGNLYIADTGNNQVRKVTASTGFISLLAGVGFPAGYSGDGGLATSAQLSAPRTLAVDEGGNVYIGDTGNSVIRKVDTDGYISTIAGTGVAGNFGDGGSAALAQFGQIFGVTADSAANLYVVDNTSNVVRKLSTSSGLVNFGNIPFGGSATATISLGNAGSQQLVVSGISVTGTGFTEATASTRGCNSTSKVAPGSECFATATFSPATLGSFTGTVSITDNAGNTQQVALIGVGTKLPATVALTSSPANYVVPGSAVSLAVKVTSAELPTTLATGTVQFFNGSTLLSTVTLDGTGSATLSLGSALAPGTYNFSAVYSGDAKFQAGTSATLVFGVQNDFAIALSSTEGAMSPGGTLSTTLTITPSGLSPAAFQLACTNQPTYITCAFSPATFAASTATLTSTLTITAKAPQVGLAGMGIVAALSMLALFALRRRGTEVRCLVAIALLAGLGAASGCGAGVVGTPTVVPVTVTVTSAQATHTLTYNVNFY